MYRYATLAFIFVTLATSINGHGRLMKPPNRSSLWRLSEFNSHMPPVNNQDNELFCGGLHQDEVVGGNCGVCGDPFSQSAPRDNEINGKWYRGIIAANYNAGQVIDVEVEITATHLGYMEWRLCSNPQGGETQACFNQHLLQRADGHGSKLEVVKDGWYRTKLRLPAGVTCNQCVIQWNYRTGNAWGECGDGSSGIGCGPLETFRGCSDISIN